MYHILIAEPNQELKIPYNLVEKILSKKAIYTRVVSLNKAVKHLKKTPPHLFFLSTQFPLEEMLRFLDTVKNHFTTDIIPIIFVVDWGQRLHQLPGTSWGGKVGIVHSLTSQEELAATLRRLLR
jgi:PleD family two-component response regulator